MVLDEAGTNLGMTRINARCLKGERAFFKCPSNRGGNISLVGAMRLDEEPILYPYDGAIDGERFLAFLDNHLIPRLRKDDVVVMDNCRIHHIKEVAERLNKVGARALYLPPYSPELNPIEEAWSLIKEAFRSLEARTIATYMDALRIARDLVTPAKVRAYFLNAGYTC